MGDDSHDLDIIPETLGKGWCGRELTRISVWDEPVADTVERGPYRSFLSSNEGDPREPPYVHVTAGERVAKFWLDPVGLALSQRLRGGETADLRSVVERDGREFVEALNAHFGTRNGATGR